MKTFRMKMSIKEMEALQVLADRLEVSKTEVMRRAFFRMAREMEPPREFSPGGTLPPEFRNLTPGELG